MLRLTSLNVNFFQNFPLSPGFGQGDGATPAFFTVKNRGFRRDLFFVRSM